jgi:hypothetical protein
MLAPPSYVTSSNRLTTPIINTKRNAGDADSARTRFFTCPVYLGVNCAFVFSAATAPRFLGDRPSR